MHSQSSSDRPMSLFFSNEPSDDKPRATVGSVVGICVGILLLPCIAVGGFWAVITFV